MPTIMSHAVVPLAAALTLGPHRITRTTMFAGIGIAMVPDLDVISFLLGIDYASQFGHRGASHSLFAAAALAGLITTTLKPDRWQFVFLFLFASMASHGLLDTLTNGGLGAALFWPMSDARIFAPITPIAVSPIAHEFFSVQGLWALVSEFFWIWLPASFAVVVARRLARNQSSR